MVRVINIRCPKCGAKRDIVATNEEEFSLKLAMILIDSSLKECYECWPSGEAERYYKQMLEYSDKLLVSSCLAGLALKTKI